MTEVRFYHLQKTPLEQALPMILEKALQGGYRALIIVPDEHIEQSLNEWLWTYKDNSFLPHGLNSDHNAKEHPVLIATSDAENLNDADMLVLTHGCVSEKIGDFKLCCEMLNGAVQEQVTGARTRWKTYKDEGFEVTYWAQDDQGRWRKKA